MRDLQYNRHKYFRQVSDVYVTERFRPVFRKSLRDTLLFVRILPDECIERERERERERRKLYR